MQEEKAKILREIDQCALELSGIGNMLKGTLNKVDATRGKNGKLRSERYSLTYKEKNNKTKTLYVRKNQADSVRRMTENHRRAKKLLNRITELNLRLFRM